MSWLVTIAVDLVLALTLLCSLSMAGAWGEMCGIRPGGDKSGLGGFTMALMLAVMRWLGVALALVVVARPGETLWLLLGHGGLGWLATHVYARSVDIVGKDRVVPPWRGIVFGVLVPLPAFTLGAVRLHGDGATDAPVALAATAAALAIAHGLTFRQRRAGMRPRT